MEEDHNVKNGQNGTDSTEVGKGLSKSQQKKLKKKLEWDAGKAERKQKRKEKDRQKAEQRRKLVEAGEEVAPSRKKLKQMTMATSSCKQRIVIDMNFDTYMSERDLGKAAKQVQRCYSSNRRAENPLQFYLSSIAGKVAQTMERNNGFRYWDVNIKEEAYVDQFPREEIVYLTSDSDNVINELDVSKVYVIGGLVDHNFHKGLCHKLALEKKVSHGRLPIDQYLNMKARKVLTIDQVFGMLLSVCNGKSWKEALLTFIPSRKGAVELPLKPVTVDKSKREAKEEAADEKPAKKLKLSKKIK